MIRCDSGADGIVRIEEGIFRTAAVRVLIDPPRSPCGFGFLIGAQAWRARLSAPKDVSILGAFFVVGPALT
jgi:hypothetical protein